MTVGQPAIQIASPKTVNDLWLDAQIRHQIGLMRVAGSIRNASWSILDATEPAIRRLIVDVTERLGSGGPAAVRRLDRLIEELAGLRSEAWTDVRGLWRRDFTEVALEEPGTMARMLRTVSPVEVDLQMPRSSELRAVALNDRYGDPSALLTLDQQWRSARGADLRRMESQIRSGVDLEESPQQIARRVVGRVSMRGRDGATERTRQNVRTISRTSVNHSGVGGRELFVKSNEEYFIEEVFVAVLDGNTTPICRDNDGKIYAIGKGPKPPLHLGCRSMRNAILDREVLGERSVIPATNDRLLREFREKNGGTGQPEGLFQEFARIHGLEKVPKRRAELPRGFKGKFDDFRSDFDDFKGNRIREMIGVKPRKVVFESWLRGESRVFQDDYLGPTRAKLFRDGGIKLKRFANPAGQEIPLRELARMHRDAFEAAGLDPSAFN